MASDNTIPIHLRADIGNVPAVMTQAAGAINSFTKSAQNSAGSMGGMSNGMGGLLKSAAGLVAGYFTLQAAIRGVERNDVLNSVDVIFLSLFEGLF